MVKILYFDYHGVLDRRTYHGLVAALLGAMGPAGTSTVQTDLEPLVYDYATGLSSPQEFWPMIEQRYGIPVAQAGKKYYLHVDPVREMWELLNILKQRFALGLMSDCARDKQEAIGHAYSLPDFFDVLIFSGDVRLTKKNPELYQYMLKDGFYLPDECVLIDDSPENAAVANSLGFPVHLFSSVPEFRQWLTTAGVPSGQ